MKNQIAVITNPALFVGSIRSHLKHLENQSADLVGCAALLQRIGADDDIAAFGGAMQALAGNVLRDVEALDSALESAGVVENT